MDGGGVYNGQRTRQHVFVPSYNLVALDVWGASTLIHNGTIGIHDPVCGNGRMSRRHHERHVRGKLAVYGAGKAHAAWCNERISFGVKSGVKVSNPMARTALILVFAKVSFSILS